MNKQETIADIIAWLRRPREGENAYLTLWRDEIADRLEAAHKREKAAIEADALSVGGIVEAMRQQEVICTKCRDGEPPKNCRFFGEPDGCNSPTYGHYPQLPIGDCAELRDALEDARNFLLKHCCGSSEAQAIISRIDCALAAPPRNCDVGTADEQAERLNEWCNGRHCINCRFKGGRLDECKLRWAQMPYVEKEGGNDEQK